MDKRFPVISGIYRRAADRQYGLEALLLDPNYTKEEHEKSYALTGNAILRWITIGVFKSYPLAREAQKALNNGDIKIGHAYMPISKSFAEAASANA